MGNVTDGNGTYVDPSISGNATSFISNPCGNVSLTFTTENPPSFVQATKRDNFDENMILHFNISDIGQVPMPTTGEMQGHVDEFTDLPMFPKTDGKRSVTSPNDWSQKVGSFSNTFVVNVNNTPGFTWLGALETDGTLRYAIYNTNQSFAILQHDYYNINGNAHFFNPGEVFPVGSFCNPVDNQTGWIHDIKRDFLTGRYVFAYFNPANYSKLCVVLSNTGDFFNGGGYGYEMNLPYLFNSAQNFQIASYNGYFSFCFDDYTQNLSNNNMSSYNGPLYWGNCFIMEYSVMITGAANPRICPLQFNFMSSNAATLMSWSSFMYHQRYPIVTSGQNRSHFVNIFQKNNLATNLAMWAYDNSYPYNFTGCGGTNNAPSYSGVFISNSATIKPALVQTPQLLNNFIAAGNMKYTADFVQLTPTISLGVLAYTDVYNSTTSSIVWSIRYLPSSLQFNVRFSPRPGLHVFAPSIRVIVSSNNIVGVVLAYQQANSNTSYAVPSTSYAYWLSTDPPGVLRVPTDPLVFNGLSNPQTITNVNGSNPVSTGLAVVPGLNEFSIFGAGNLGSYIHQNFRIAGERFTRTFTLTDGCGSTSCVQELYLNSTRSLILTCPATYYGTIFEGNGTYLSPAVTGNATTYIGSPCGSATLTFTTENPPTNNVQQFKRQDFETIIDPNATSVDLGPPVEGHLMGLIEVFTDLPMPMMTENQTSPGKRSVTSPRDWAQQVGNFGTTYNITSSYTQGFNWISSLETDGVLRYAVYNTNQSFAILQHDYYDINGNAHFFNPGEVFPSGSPCDVPPGTSTTGWQHDLKRDIKLNRYVFVYFNVSVTNIMCLVISNTSDFFNGGAVGYEIMLTSNSTYFGSNQRLRFSINGDMYSFCFDDFTQSSANNNNSAYIGPLYWGNCFALERARIIIGASTPRLCSLQLNMLDPSFRIYGLYSVEMLHQTTLIENATGIATGTGYVKVVLVQFPTTQLWILTTANADFTFWDFNLACIITANGANNVGSPTTIINFASNAVPIYENLKYGNAVPTKVSSDIQDPQLRVFAWTIVDSINNTKIGWSVHGFFVNNLPLNLGYTFTSVFDPYPGNYTHGVHVFAPTIKILPNKAGIVIAYQQSTLNPTLSLPSTSYAYWLKTDPPGVLRPAVYPLFMNNLANPQRLTETNMTNPLSTGLAIHPTKLEFSIFGPGDAASANSWSFINQNFRIAGERWTRTFTLSDACGNTSCVQEIYLNSTI
jgi:hypothetical protein